VTVPASVLKMLQNNNVPYSITPNGSNVVRARGIDLSTAPGVCAVKSLLLQDEHGRVQILLPANSLLDLDALYQQFGRQFEGVSPAELKPLFREHQLTNVPAFPGWNNLPTLVDASLLRPQTLWLDSGSNDHYLELALRDFLTLTKTSETGEFAAPLPLPATPAEDRDSITKAVSNFTQMRIHQRLEETLELPPLPETAQSIIRLRADPNGDINDLANIVEIDPSLAAQVVSWAASPYYSAPGKIKSVHDAIVRVLGFDMVLNLALGLSLGKTLKLEDMNKKQLRAYWQKAVYTAAAVEGLVTCIAREHRPGFGLAYLSGLLSNFGELVLAEVFPPHFAKVRRYVKANPHVPASAIEQHLLGCTGTQMAAWLMEVWNMPEEMVVALRQQDNAQYDGEHAAYAQILFVARQMLANKSFGDHEATLIPDKIFEKLHLDRATAEITVDNILEANDDLDALAEQMPTQQ
jgi:HD-like signal output (HDOD) protein/prolyl-tRNA editing enzyme YbaK/EbsC (Cys-tRNA(Pro) deacylase)